MIDVRGSIQPTGFGTNPGTHSPGLFQRACWLSEQETKALFLILCSLLQFLPPRSHLELLPVLPSVMECDLRVVREGKDIISFQTNKERKGKYDPADNFNLNPKWTIYINPHTNKDQGTLLVRKQRECKSRHIDEVLWKSLQDVTLLSNHGQIIAMVTRQDLDKIKLNKACPRPCWLSSVVQLRKNWQ